MNPGWSGPANPRLCYYPFEMYMIVGKYVEEIRYFRKWLRSKMRSWSGILMQAINNDLYQNRIHEHPEFQEQSVFLETLKKMEVFPQKWLKENGKSIKRIMCCDKEEENRLYRWVFDFENLMSWRLRQRRKRRRGKRRRKTEEKSTPKTRFRNFALRLKEVLLVIWWTEGDRNRGRSETVSGKSRAILCNLGCFWKKGYIFEYRPKEPCEKVEKGTILVDGVRTVIKFGG